MFTSIGKQYVQVAKPPAARKPFNAEQYLPGNIFPFGASMASPHDPDQRPFVTPLRGIVRLNPGDWVVDTSEGFTPVPNAEFVQLYQPLAID